MDNNSKIYLCVNMGNGITLTLGTMKVISYFNELTWFDYQEIIYYDKIDSKAFKVVLELINE